MKNMKSLNEFKSMKNSKLNETVTMNGNDFVARNSITVPGSLVSAYMKKVKDESGQDLLNTHSKDQISELLVNYVADNFLNIENFPTSIVLGTAATQVQPQAQMQVQGQAQPQAQLDDAQAQNIQAQTTAQEIPAQEDGQAQTIQGQVQGQGQGQTQGQPSIQGQDIQGTQTQAI